MIEHESVWSDLATMWEADDPMPDDLVDTLLVAVAAEDVGTEYEMLRLVERSRGRHTEGIVDDAVIEYTGGGFRVLLRVRDLGPGHRRVDGWVAPTGPMTVSVRQGSASWDTSVSRLGRFELPRLPAGLSRLWIRSAAEPPRADDDGRLVATTTIRL